MIEYVETSNGWGRNTPKCVTFYPTLHNFLLTYWFGLQFWYMEVGLVDGLITWVSLQTSKGCRRNTLIKVKNMATL